MKTKLLLIGLLSLVMTLPIMAQTDTIPNFSFENWSTVNGMAEPDNWTVEKITTTETDSNGDIIDILGVVSSTSQANDSYTGNYALKLYSKRSFTVNYTNEILSVLGKIYSFFPTSARHTTLNGYYKYAPENGDSCQVIIALYKHGYVNLVNAAYGNMVGYGSLCKSTSSSYTPFSVTVNYFDTSTIPDSANILISAYKQMDIRTMARHSPLGSNSELYVDNLSFDGFTTGINTISSVKEVTIFPNPASSIVTIDMLLKEANYQVNLYDLKGSLVKNIANEKLAGKQQIAVNVENIPAGNYLLIISTNDGYVSKKLIIQQ